MRFTAAILLLWSTTCLAQFNNFQSLNAPFGARNAALGGQVVSLADGDLFQFVHNPAVLDSVKSTSVGINISPYFADILSFSGAYQAEFSNIGSLAFGVTYLDYGDFAETADNGDELGTFQSSDLLLTLGKSHHIGAFSLGANMKYASNGVAGYGSSLLLFDLGGIYRSTKADFTAGLVFQNFGFVLNDFSASSESQVPFDVKISTSFKPEYMPFRFSISAYNLTQRDLYYQVASDINKSRTVELADQLLRRINIGTELILGDNLQLLLGYSHLRRQELKIGEEGYGAGFSYGFLLGIKQFQIRYAHATYHAAGGTDFFSIQTNLHSFKKIL
ncbi:MAG: type IX secretion system protein PorQ [Cyclobacteriaceae bacterium]